MISETAWLWVPIVFFILVRVMQKYAFSQLNELKMISDFADLIGKRKSLQNKALKIASRILVISFGSVAIMYFILVDMKYIDILGYTIPTILYILILSVLIILGKQATTYYYKVVH